jgi:hypothetical protein
MASAGSAGRSNGNSSHKARYPYFALCVDNRGCEGSLTTWKIYRVMKPQRNDAPKDVRVVDEEGEDYLYSSDQFIPIDLPPKARRAIEMAK